MGSQEEFDKERAKVNSHENPFADLEGDFVDLAVTGHEIYASYIRAGFSEKQAIYLVGCMATGNPGNPPAE